jgi:hypothetical protein
VVTLGAVEWLEVVENAGPKPVRDAGMIGSDELPIVAGPIVVAWGTVDGIPWQVDAGVTGPSPRGDWWNHGPVGPELALSVGFEGTFGGGGGPTHLNEGTHLTADIGFFGSIPRLVSWLGVVSDEVDSLEVRLDDGNRRTIEIRDVPLDRFPRAFWFFPPRGAPGQVVALAADGRELQRERLVDLDVHPMSNAGTGVNGFGFRTDRPRPGGRTTRRSTDRARVRGMPRTSTSTRPTSPSMSPRPTAGTGTRDARAADRRAPGSRTSGSATSTSPAVASADSRW